MAENDAHPSILIGAVVTVAAMALLIHFLWFPGVDDTTTIDDDDDEAVVVVEEAPPESERLELGDFEEFASNYAEHYRLDPRHLIHVTLDRPMYRPGQQIRWKSWHVSAGSFDRRDASDRQITVELENPRGDLVEEVEVDLEHGLADGSFSVDAEAAGGNWTLRVTDGAEEFERPVLVSAFEPSRFRKAIDFSKDAYRPGELVEVEVEILRDTGDAPQGLEITGYADVDGEHITDLSGTLDAQGRIELSFDLPDQIISDDANLVISVEDGGIVESEVRPIPLALQEVTIDFYPEGGELIEDLTSRVYFEARDLSGAPVGVQGRIVDGDDRTVAELEADADGRGRFEFTPEPYQTYQVALDEPDVDVRQTLPRIEAEGCILRVYDDLESRLDEIRAGVWCSDERRVAVMGAMADELFDTAVVEAGPDEPAVVYLKAEDGWPRPAGIARVIVAEKETSETRWEEITELKLLAERVLFRNRSAQMHIEIRTDGKAYHPGETVELEIITTDPEGEPLRAELVKAVVDDRVHAQATDQAPSILGRLLLEADDLHFWGDVERADRYFDLDDPEAAVALDYLMGARGWRTGDQHRRFLVDGGDNWIDPQLNRHSDRPRDIEIMRGDSGAGVGFGGGGAGAGGGGRTGSPPPRPSAPAAESPAADRMVAQEAGALAAFDDAPVDMEMADHRSEEPGESPLMDSEHGAPGAEKPRWFRDDDAGAFAAWAASMMTDRSGTVSRDFELSEAIGAYRITVEGISHDGYVGFAETVVPVELPLSVALRMPEILSGGDTIELPVTLRNSNDTSVTADVELSSRGPVTVEGDASFQVDVPAGGTTTEFVAISVGDYRGEGAIEVFAEGGGFADGAERTFQIEPAGYRRTWHQSGSLPGENAHEIPLIGMTDIGATGDLLLYPNPVSEAMEGAESMTRRPTGCFEQTSSINHPNLLVWRYLDAMGQLDGDVKERLQDHIDYGFERMLSFEVSGGGFDWFGRGPANAALTAWGLAQFSQMKEIVTDFDDDVIDRTARWLRTLADDDGGWHDRGAWSRTYGAQRNTAELFVLYGLARADALDGFEAQLEAAKQTALNSDRIYDVALAAAVLAIDGRDEETLEVAVDRLMAMQNDDGSWSPDAGRSWARSFGTSLDVETTGLAVQALLAADGPPRNISQAVDWLGDNKSRSGWWGSTQATVMALEARIAYEQAYLGDDTGPVRVTIGDEVVAEEVLSTDTLNALRIENVGRYLSADRTTLNVDSDVPANYDLEISWRVQDFDADGDPPLSLNVDIGSADRASMGDEVPISVTLKNREDDSLGMSVAHISLPAGVEVSPRQLDSLVERTDVDFFETTGREIILYFEDFDGEERQEISFSGVAAVPGTFDVPASVAYPYYRDEDFWQWGQRSTFRIDVP